MAVSNLISDADEFGEKWIKWIKYTFSTLEYYVLVNRSPVVFLSPKRGIRQGDLLSPFLFILAMEELSRVLEKAKQLHWREGFDVGEVLVHQFLCLTYCLPMNFLWC